VSLVDRHASERNLLNVSAVGAATAAEHSEVPELPAQRAIATAEIDRIADVEIGCCVELGMTARRRVRTQAAQPRRPPSPLRSASAKCVGYAQLSM
jgi:hypothetical protein